MIRRLLFLFPLLLLGAAESSSQPVVLNPEQAEKEGHALAAELLSLRPAQGTTNKGVMTIRLKSKRTEFPVRFEIAVTPTNWQSIYEAALTNDSTTTGKAAVSGSRKERVVVTHLEGQPNRYEHVILPESALPSGKQSPVSDQPAGDKLMVPFAGSDFWLADFGLEFFHWPKQRLVKKEVNRSRYCRVLESVNPQPAPGGYARVVSWIDDESYGLVQADAFDANNRLLKQFFPKRVRRVQGEYQLAEMQINNIQTGSRTSIEFSFEAK